MCKVGRVTATEDVTRRLGLCPYQVDSSARGSANATYYYYYCVCHIAAEVATAIRSTNKRGVYISQAMRQVCGREREVDYE